MVPQWYINFHRVTYWNKIGHPAQPPLYYNPFSWLTYWWIDPAKEQALAEAMKANKALPKP
jgi:ABC-type oligopeptide transport system substrate-binding subunit